MATHALSGASGSHDLGPESVPVDRTALLVDDERVVALNWSAAVQAGRQLLAEPIRDRDTALSRVRLHWAVHVTPGVAIKPGYGILRGA
jgi:hypothetical protein